MADSETPSDRSREDIPSLTPVGGTPFTGQPATPAPQPVLLGAGMGGVVAQPWASPRKVFPMKVSLARATNRNNVSEFRTGEVAFESATITLQGKAILPAHIRRPIILVSILLRVGWLIAAVIIEYVIRVNRVEMLSLDNIELIVLEPETQRACIAYHLPAKPKTSYSLGLKLEGGLYNEFARTVSELMPDRVTTGKLLPPTPLWVWIVLGVIVLAVIVGIIISSTGPH